MQRIAPIATLTLAVLAGCGPLAPSASRPAPDSDAVVIRVAHDIRSASTLTVYLLTPLGSQLRLGPLRPGGYQEFRLDEEPVSGDYQLVAQLPDGRTFTSRSFILIGRDGVEWSPGADIVTAISRR
jgi:hypothetical protein